MTSAPSFLDAAPPSRRHDPCRFRHPRRLVALAAVRHGCQKRRVGFDQQAVVGDEGGDVPQLPGLRKRDDAGERDEEPQIQRPPRLVDRAAEAVHHAAQPARPRFADHRERVVGGLRVWMTTGSATFERDGHLRAKHVLLDGRRRKIVVVVEADFSDRDGAAPVDRRARHLGRLVDPPRVGAGPMRMDRRRKPHRFPRG